ncbi:putative oxidoreductase YtbE [Aphomia sociella]
MAASTDFAYNAKFTLCNGTIMPAVGLGTYRIRRADVIMNTVDYALDAGYRMFDTAAVYGNEYHLKDAFQTLLPKYGLEREDIFITTKLSPSDHGSREVTERAYRKSLENLGLEYVDLYLIHFPGTSRIPSDDVLNIKIRNQTWAGLAKLYDEGLVKAIGVSNFTVRHLREIMSTNHGVVPTVNQVEWHPYYYQSDLLEYCKTNNIVLQAYCSFGGTSSANMSLMQDPAVKNIAKKLNVTCAQVLLKWALQQGVAVIPKSTNPDRIRENISLKFKIPEEDIKALNALGKHMIKYAWDPNPVA